MQLLAQTATTPTPAEITAIMVGVMIGLAILLIPTIFFLLALQKALTRCSPESRTLSPGLVWLQLVPLLNIVWIFINVINVSKSLGNEFRKRGIPESPAPAQGVGLAWAICSVVSIIPFVGYLTGIAALVCWIIYWVKVAGYSSQIAAPVPAPQVA
jgi:hypothetical protein